MRNGSYHYTESGLDSVFLKGGYEYHDTPGGKTVTIQDIEGLHRTIGRTLACRGRLKGKEFRFLRSELLLSQASLAKVLGVKELTVGRWEKGQTDIPFSAEVVVRMLFVESLGNKNKPAPKIKDFLERIADLEDGIDRHLTFKKQNGHWIAEAA
jgi:DNA-binding transcriptional regulator YiaG